MLTLMMVITGNVQPTGAENEGPSELVLFFDDYKIPLSHWLYIIFLWSFDKSNKGFRDTCSLKILHGKIKLDGRGKTVEMDESGRTEYQTLLYLNVAR